jgi:hypothetical protein
VSARIVLIDPTMEGNLNTAGSLIVQLNKALYGVVIASQLWYIKLRDKILSFGFHISVIDRCVFYGRLLGHLLYLCVHVDDIGIFSDNDASVSELERLLTGVFTKANVDRSNPLAFIGMNLTSTDDAIFVDMTRYETECCASWGVTASLDTPAGPNIFVDDPASILLSPEKAKDFQSCQIVVPCQAFQTRHPYCGQCEFFTRTTGQ